jgi:hypothetical protein
MLAPRGIAAGWQDLRSPHELLDRDHRILAGRRVVTSVPSN